MFLYQAARSSEETTGLHDRLEHLRVADVMTPRSMTVDAATPLRAMPGDDFGGRRLAAFPVVRDDHLVGFLPWRRMSERIADGVTAGDAMVPIRSDDVVAPDSSAWLAFLKTGRNRAGRVAVVDGGRLVGTVSRDDLEKAARLQRLRADVGRRAA